MGSSRQLRLGAFMRPVGIHTAWWRYPGAWPDANFNLEHLIRFAQKLEHGESIVVGVNKFRQDAGQQAPPVFRMDPEIERQQIERVRELRASRAAAAVEEKLAGLERGATAGDNLMPRILACCKSLATVGEISDRLRKVFGEYRSS